MNIEESLKPDNMIRLYASGAFPMADEDDLINWYLPEIRTIIPLNNYNIPRSLKKFLPISGFEFRKDFNYLDVINGCADREETWISDKLIKAYKRIQKRGFLHSVETWKDGELVGGLYGISFRGCFFGESMFSRVPQASKAALYFLINHLVEKGFTLLDVQYMTPHLKMFGAVEITMQEYEKILWESYLRNCEF